MSIPRFVAHPSPPEPEPGRVNGHGHPHPLQIDYRVVRLLHARVTDTLTTLLADAANVTTAYRRELAQRVGREIVADYAIAMAHAGQPVSPAQENALLDAVVAGMFGAGRLQRLLDDPSITNVHIIGCDQVLCTTPTALAALAIRWPTATRSWSACSRSSRCGWPRPSDSCPNPTPSSICSCPTARE